MKDFEVMDDTAMVDSLIQRRDYHRGVVDGLDIAIEALTRRSVHTSAAQAEVKQLLSASGVSGTTAVPPVPPNAKDTIPLIEGGGSTFSWEDLRDAAVAKGSSVQAAGIVWKFLRGDELGNLAAAAKEEQPIVDDPANNRDLIDMDRLLALSTLRDFDDVVTDGLGVPTNKACQLFWRLLRGDEATA